MWRLIACLLAFCVVSSFGGKCTLYYDAAFPGIFTQKFGSKTKLLVDNDGLINFDDRLTISAYCPGEFKYYIPYYGSSNDKFLRFTCNGNTVQITDSRSTHTYDWNQAMVQCYSSAQYWEADVKGCSHQGFVFGFSIDDKLITLADVCYDPDIQRTWFIRYTSGLRSPLVENQDKYNSANLTNATEEVWIDSHLEDEKKLLTQAVTSALPNYDGEKVYEMQDLMPLSGMGYLKKYGWNLESTNQIAWWTPLKYGNWKLLEDIISKISATQSLDIYTGVSGKILYPVNDKCDSTDILTYGNDMFQKTVPLYVWRYVKPLDSPDEPGVVILGVNSPFLDISAGVDLLCEDICHTVEWMGFLSKMRKLPGLGYIFCCRPEEVEGKLDGFPK